jgi:AraC family transcriptional regulator
MEWLDRMNEALDYIEDNLEGTIDMKKIAQHANCSSFNFQRMFSFIAGVSLADYIRKRRLSLAAMELLSKETKVIDVAMKYGYDSPVSFARAFYAVHELNPSMVRKPGVKMKTYPRLSFEIVIKGVEAMDFRMEELGEFRLVGYKISLRMDNEDNQSIIPQFWGEACQDGRCEKMLQYNNNEKLRCLGVCANPEGENFDYYITTGSNQEIPEDLEQLIVPAGCYAIFECVGKMPEGQQNMWKRIFTEWFSKSGYDMAEGPQIEWYSEGDMSSEEYYSEIWIPVSKK